MAAHSSRRPRPSPTRRSRRPRRWPSGVVPAVAAVVGEVGRVVHEARELRLPDELDRGDRAVPVLADDQLGLVRGGCILRILVLLVDGLAVDEHDDVGVLFYRAGVVRHDPVSEPAGWPRYRQVEYLFLARALDRDDAIPEQIAVGGSCELRRIEQRGVTGDDFA